MADEETSTTENFEDTESTAAEEIGNVDNSTQVVATSQPIVKQKIDVLLRPAGSAKAMKQKKYRMDPDRQIGHVNCFVKKYFNMEAHEPVVQFLYISQSFAPAQDETLRNLYACFGSDGMLVIQYCMTQAWG